ncbi:MAG: hypothetical protein AMXMBFR46_15750 [Acidimicrobiia bacterium]
MPGPIAVLDADVLVPIIACDFLLTAFDHGLYEPVVSATALREVERTLVEDLPHLDPRAIRHRVAAMRSALDDQLVDVDPQSVPAAINAKDRHIVGAAIQGEASLIVTNDRRLRDELDASDLALNGVDLDTFATTLWESTPAEIGLVVDSLIRKRTRRPVSRSEMLDALRNHMPNLIQQLANDEPGRTHDRRSTQ